MSNPTFKPSEGKREEFRKYLEKNGVMDALTKVLVNLYEEPEKPEDALEYIRDRLAMQAGIETYNQLKAKLDDFQTRIDNLTHELEESKIAPVPQEGEEEGMEQVPEEECPPVKEEVLPESAAEEKAPENPE